MELSALLADEPELRALVEESLAKAALINPDRDTNPAQDLESLYAFLEWSRRCEPWDTLHNASYPSLYDHLDQSVDYFWFLFDQPLEALEGRGYYYPSLQYHEPIASWCREYARNWGSFLSTRESWSDECYRRFLAAPEFKLDSGWYADHNIWQSWNDFFARKLSSPAVRPVAADAEVVSPADSSPQGVWRIDDCGNLVAEEGVEIKSGIFRSARQLVGEDSRYAGAFDGGTLTHTFLDVNDYHRYHFPVDGTVAEVRKVPGTNAAGGITVWHPESRRYVLDDRNPGWQMIETRDCVVLETAYGPVAVLPIGMSQICSCNWEEGVRPGAKVRRGDPMGYFLFGGSDIVMLFPRSVRLGFMPRPDGRGGFGHLLMGQAYATLSPVAGR